MSQLLELSNFGKSNRVEESLLDADVPAAATTFPIKDPHAFAADYFVIIGPLGQENTEMRRITGVTGNVLTVPALARAHSIYDPVLLINGDSIQVWRAANTTTNAEPALAAYATLLSPVTIAYDDLVTQFTDPNGGSDFWYRFTYVNSVTSGTSNLADSQGVRGGGAGDYVSTDAIRQEAGFTRNRNISNVIINDARQAAQSEINAALKGVYLVPFTEPINQLITYIAKILAAGKLLKEQYGVYNTNDTANGQNKIDEAEAYLEKLKSGQLVLLNPDGSSPTVPGDGTTNTRGFSGYPNNDTANEEDGSDFMFKRKSIDGYQGRQY